MPRQQPATRRRPSFVFALSLAVAAISAMSLITSIIFLSEVLVVPSSFSAMDSYEELAESKSKSSSEPSVQHRNQQKEELAEESKSSSVLDNYDIQEQPKEPAESKCVIGKQFIKEIPDDVLKRTAISSLNTNATTSGGKIISPGNHTNVPHPDCILGPNNETHYVHDPTFLHSNHGSNDKDNIGNAMIKVNKNDSFYQNICAPAGKGDEQEWGYRNLKRIRNYMEQQSKTSSSSSLLLSSNEPTIATTKTNNNTKRDVKLFCAVYAISERTYNTDAISDTWGRKCDGLLYASDETNIQTGHVYIPNMATDFKYGGVYQRVRAMHAYIYDNFIDEYDFFHFGGDDTYVIVENLLELLSSQEVYDWEYDGGEQNNQYFIGGFWAHWNYIKRRFGEHGFYFTGGPGYVLSRKALKAYVEGPMQYCEAYTNTPEEDIMFATCVHNHFTNKFFDTRDEFGAHRFLMHNITAHSYWKPGEQHRYGGWMNVLDQSLDFMKREFGFPKVVQDAFISNSTISMHKHTPSQQKRMEMLLYGDLEHDCEKTDGNE
jgi:hypothetical protein